MKIYNILDQKTFTKQLFIEEVFDNFLVIEADFITEFGIYFDGHKTDFEIGEDEYISWGVLKRQAFEAIKGSKLPKGFRIVLKLSMANTANTLRSLGIEQNAETGLYLNVKYSDGSMTLTGGTSTTEFSVVKDLDRGWERFLEKFFLMKSISYEEL